MERYLPNSESLTMKKQHSLLSHMCIDGFKMVELLSSGDRAVYNKDLNDKFKTSLTNCYDIDITLYHSVDGEIMVYIKPFNIKTPLVLKDPENLINKELNIAVLRYKKNKVSVQDIKFYLT